LKMFHRLAPTKKKKKGKRDCVGGKKTEKGGCAAAAGTEGRRKGSEKNQRRRCRRKKKKRATVQKTGARGEKIGGWMHGKKGLKKTGCRASTRKKKKAFCMKKREKGEIEATKRKGKKSAHLKRGEGKYNDLGGSQNMQKKDPRGGAGRRREAGKQGTEKNIKKSLCPMAAKEKNVPSPEEKNRKNTPTAKEGPEKKKNFPRCKEEKGAIDPWGIDRQEKGPGKDRIFTRKKKKVLATEEKNRSK